MGHKTYYNKAFHKQGFITEQKLLHSLIILGNYSLNKKRKFLVNTHVTWTWVDMIISAVSV